jgi:hypothetical protein
MNPTANDPAIIRAGLAGGRPYVLTFCERAQAGQLRTGQGWLVGDPHRAVFQLAQCP